MNISRDPWKELKNVDQKTHEWANNQVKHTLSDSYKKILSSGKEEVFEPNYRSN